MQAIAWVMGIMNVAIEALGVVIDFFVKRDTRKKAAGTFGPGRKMETNSYLEQKPFLMRGGKGGKYEKLDDPQLEQLDSLGDEIDGGLNDQQK